MNILFVCNQGQNRSKTASEILNKQFNTRYAGIYNNLITEKDMEWADIIIVMEDHHRSYIGKIFPKQYMKKRIISLNIPDIYRYNQPELIEILKHKFKESMSLIA